VSDPSDQAGLAGLIGRLRSRDPAAFDELYRCHRASVWRFLRQLAGPGAAEDLFQDTWLSAARHAHLLAEDTHLLAWLCTIARNKHRNAVRLGVFDARRVARAAAEPQGAPALPDEQVDLRARARAVADAFRQLPEVYREVLLLHAVEGLDSEAIGRVLDLRGDAVRKRLSRARAELTRLTERTARP
jgi:RNA polymerase sigma-70 factor (ECF subfamily)